MFSLNGAIYLTRREVLLKERSFYTKATYAYVMPHERSLDIDSDWDLYLADLIIKSSFATGHRSGSTRTPVISESGM